MTTWSDRIRMRLSGGERDIPWWVNNKVKLFRFCSENQLPVPQIMQSWKHPDELDLSDAPDEFVLKPSVMHSSWGVMLLKRVDEPGKFHESLSNRTLTEAIIQREQTSVYEKCQYKNEYRLFIEEKVINEAVEPGVDVTIPLDYKIFCFYDQVRLVEQMDRNTSPKQMAWFDGKFDPVEMPATIESDWSKIDSGQHRRPERWQEMLEIASRATKLLSTPFMRIDMFAASRGPIIGEMTPTPGGPYYRDWYSFTPSFEEDLGRAWAGAEERANST